jgi:hypothetical protein
MLTPWSCSLAARRITPERHRYSGTTDLESLDFLDLIQILGHMCGQYRLQPPLRLNLQRP